MKYDKYTILAYSMAALPIVVTVVFFVCVVLLVGQCTEALKR